MKKLDKFTEFETKYRVDGDLQFKFKAIMSDLDYKSFLYAEGPDYYYTKEDKSFLRYRKATTEKRAEVTLKQQINDNNNIIRKETNWRVDGTSKEEIHEGAVMMGFNFNFSIFKICHIYTMKDGTNIVFYTVRDQKNNLDHFIEIELNEKTIHNYTEEEAMNKIRQYEEILAPLGITHRNRLNKSLFDMYIKEL